MKGLAPWGHSDLTQRSPSDTTAIVSYLVVTALAVDSTNSQSELLLCLDNHVYRRGLEVRQLGTQSQDMLVPFWNNENITSDHRYINFVRLWRNFNLLFLNMFVPSYGQMQIHKSIFCSLYVFQITSVKKGPLWEGSCSCFPCPFLSC